VSNVLKPSRDAGGARLAEGKHVIMAEQEQFFLLSPGFPRSIRGCREWVSLNTESVGPNAFWPTCCYLLPSDISCHDVQFPHSVDLSI